jgi:hypothetical protein
MPNLEPFRAPNLNLAPRQYDPAQQERFANQLRLYFVQLDNLNAELIKSVNNLSVMQWLNSGEM